MTTIGIDFSMSSVGITIHKNGKYLHYSAINRYQFSAAKSETYSFNSVPEYKKQGLIGLDKYLIFDRPPNKRNKKTTDKFVELNKWHASHLNGCETITDAVMSLLSEHLNSDARVIFEHYITSRGSGGDNTIQIIEATYRLKHEIKKITERIFVVAAPTIKKFAGKGNYQKADMVNAYLADTNISHPFKNNVKKNKEKFVKSPKEVLKPIDDIIDSYFITRFAIVNNL